MLKSIIKSRIIMMSRSTKQKQLSRRVHHNHVLMIIQLILIFCTTDCNCIGNWNSGKKASMTASSSSTSSQQQQQQQQTNSKNEDDDGGGGGGGGENNNNIDNNNNSKKTTVSSTPGSGSTSTIEDHDDDDVDVDMNKTYLDLFGESAKEFLTKKRNIKIIKKINKNIINPENNTLDQNCKWDWKYIRCEPFCECSFQYKLPNDLFYPHLGRACRNRKNQQQVNENENENEIKTKKESKDEILYRTYCSNDNDSDSSNDDNNDIDKSRRLPPPPPPSIQIHIPSPIPIVTRYVKSIWKIIRNRSDIVMNHANNEFEIVHGKLQNIVCQDLKTRCDTDSDSDNDNDIDDNNGNKQNSSSASYSPIITMVAWQERLLCQEIIRECVVVVVDGEE